MRFSIVICALCLLTVPALAGDLDVQRDWVPDYGQEYRQGFGDDIYQRYDWGTPRYDQELRRSGDRLNVYEDGVKQYGDYYERRSDGSWQKYENYVPKYGDQLEDDGF